jgi:NAD(P)-dependent dehydrogenase (short-subunit alcohol dehydrogenase family)
LKKEAGEHASRLHTFELNVRSDESVAKARKYVEENLGNYKFHGLVNNAGLKFTCYTVNIGLGIGGAYFPATATPIEVYTEVMDTNFFSMCRMTNQFSPLLKRDG